MSTAIKNYIFIFADIVIIPFSIVANRVTTGNRKFFYEHYYVEFYWNHRFSTQNTLDVTNRLWKITSAMEFILTNAVFKFSRKIGQFMGHHRCDHLLYPISSFCSLIARALRGCVRNFRNPHKLKSHSLKSGGFGGNGIRHVAMVGGGGLGSRSPPKMVDLKNVLESFYPNVVR